MLKKYSITFDHSDGTTIRTGNTRLRLTIRTGPASPPTPSRASGHWLDLALQAMRSKHDEARKVKEARLRTTMLGNTSTNCATAARTTDWLLANALMDAYEKAVPSSVESIPFEFRPLWTAVTMLRPSMAQRPPRFHPYAGVAMRFPGFRPGSMVPGMQRPGARPT